MCWLTVARNRNNNVSPKNWVFAGVSENQSKVGKFRMVSKEGKELGHQNILKRKNFYDFFFPSFN